ncbi:MAG: NAD-dependent deacetylase [Alphaproteobacteria bacterium]|nr:NAD-dependent deacetylase [Alphaproteobacteria bacterium]
MGEDAAALAALLETAEAVTVFTGAGISTESGIPDFRSPGGLWTKMKPIYFEDFLRSEEVRREAWRRKFESEGRLWDAKPNRGHYAIAKLVAQGRARSVITQNVDDLHRASGVPAERIVELHGNATYAKCLSCGERHEHESFRAAFLERGAIPSCRSCGGIVKTATISFGQAMPEAEMARAQEAALACDLFLCVGTSLTVYPAAAFPAVAKRNGARLVILNRDPTDQDDIADLVIHAGAGDVLAAATRLEV